MQILANANFVQNKIPSPFSSITNVADMQDINVKTIKRKKKRKSQV